ncbi:hypothetical protein HPP92_011795 [Vanilla planifolia]|uniref:MSP domain-containing protein n=1 Tax=Vanilla planifolia TaxID=51239 RepID=A0A835R1B2_VANPL|nr:hypothetical protein HPP92_011795 [Vanilla planifolia]
MNAVKKKSALLLSSTAPVGGFGESPAVDTLIELLNPLSAFINGKPKGSLNLWQEETKKHHPMDRLIGLEPSNRVTVRIEPGKRCYGCLTLRNVMHTMPVAYRLLPLNRPRFNVRPETGIIAPLATLTVEITYLPPPPPAPLLPESVPESDESFFLDSVVAAGASVKDGASFSSLDAVPADWFTAKKKQVFSDSGIRLYFVGSAVLSRLVADGDMVKVREVLEFSDREWHSADSVDARGQTLLHLAISRGRADLVQLILEFDANVNATNLAGRSALEAAAAVGEVLIAELLLARGASTRRSQGSNWGPLHHSAAAGHLELLQLLLLHGAAPDLPAADGLTALHLAAEERRKECVATLLSAGALAEARGGAAGYTALHVAASTGDEATARLLVEKGCAGLREARDSAGMTAYDVAAKEGHRGFSYSCVSGRLWQLQRGKERLEPRRGQSRREHRRIGGTGMDGPR